MGDASGRGTARVYARESAVVAVFISADDAGRDWARLERISPFSFRLRFAVIDRSG